MRDIIFLLNLQGWGKLVEEDSDMAPIDRLEKRFIAPLEATEADTDVIKSKSFDMIAHCAIHCPLFSWLLVCVVETFSCSKLS